MTNCIYQTRIFSLVIPLVVTLSCTEGSENIQGVLFDTDNFAANIDYSIDYVFDTNGDGRFGSEETYGFDLSVTNESDVTLQNFRSTIIEVTNSRQTCTWNSYQCIIPVDSDYEVEFGNISPNQTKIGDNYFCNNCKQVNEIRIGNFYLQSAYIDFNRPLDVRVTILSNYTIDSEILSDEYSFIINVQR
jgi:hypothetical protein